MQGARVPHGADAGVDARWRFRDDGFILGHDRTLIHAFFSEFRRRACPFEIKCDDFSRKSEEFLEVSIHLCGDGQIRTKPFCKPSALQMPLSIQSAHSRHVHNSWPVGQLLRLNELVSTANERRDIRQTLVNRFKSYFCSASANLTGNADLISKHSRNDVKLVQRQNLAKVVWLPMAFHNSWAAFLNDGLRIFCNDPQWSHLCRSALGETLDIRFARKNVLPCHLSLLSSTAKVVPSTDNPDVDDNNDV